MAPRAMWVFGYGSLIWRPGFDFEERRVAVARDHARRLWQGSPDHRGTPEAPGRVVTLVPVPGASAVGMAYRVSDRRVNDVLAELDRREQAGYVRKDLALDADGVSFTALTYLAEPGNPSWLGPATDAVIADHVRRSRGPSGANVEYVRELVAALRGLGADDAHLYGVEALLG